ncbi:MAG: NUDIX hydrolase [Candidatus Saccharimonadales bacterium]|jgi:8-oxo-dGTP diphosphatase
MSEVILKVAAKAVIMNAEGKILIVREADTYEEGTKIGKWGLPGGRIDDNEAFYDGLAREVMEETGLSVAPERPVYVGEWWPVIKDVPHHIVAMFILCSPLSDHVTLSDEHDDFAWISQDECASYQIMPPDDKPIKSVFMTDNASGTNQKGE